MLQEPCKSSFKHPKNANTKCPRTSTLSVKTFHAAKYVGLGLNFDIIVPDATMPIAVQTSPTDPVTK